MPGINPGAKITVSRDSYEPYDPKEKKLGAEFVLDETNIPLGDMEAVESSELKE